MHERAVHERVDPAEALDRLRRELPALRALGNGGTQLQHVACDAASAQPALARDPTSYVIGCGRTARHPPDIPQYLGIFRVNPRRHA
ncbi:hypothetical protein [Burkholderia ambifaria]|uniref:hypothetical protein n=1 Tax=Burkholderia ambifaria TaxID=152480 RepID=UPI001F2D1E1D|nr:hypothetical protein [Burkholderia ambifaria]